MKKIVCTVLMATSFSANAAFFSAQKFLQLDKSMQMGFIAATIDSYESTDVADGKFCVPPGVTLITLNEITVASLQQTQKQLNAKDNTFVKVRLNRGRSNNPPKSEEEFWHDIEVETFNSQLNAAEYIISVISTTFDCKYKKDSSGRPIYVR